MIGDAFAMTDEKFIGMGKHEVVEWLRKNTNTPEDFTEADVFVVWYCKTLQNWKGLFGTYDTLRSNMYFELTLNGDKNELYLDAYMKVENVPIMCKPVLRSFKQPQKEEA